MDEPHELGRSKHGVGKTHFVHLARKVAVADESVRADKEFRAFGDVETRLARLKRQRRADYRVIEIPCHLSLLCIVCHCDMMPLAVKNGAPSCDGLSWRSLSV